jgi:hypothetical protein
MEAAAGADRGQGCPRATAMPERSGAGRQLGEGQGGGAPPSVRHGRRKRGPALAGDNRTAPTAGIGGTTISGGRQGLAWKQGFALSAARANSCGARPKRMDAFCPGRGVWGDRPPTGGSALGTPRADPTERGRAAEPGSGRTSAARSPPLPGGRPVGRELRRRGRQLPEPASTSLRGEAGGWVGVGVVRRGDVCRCEVVGMVRRLDVWRWLGRR